MSRKKLNIEEAAAKALLHHVIDLLEWDEEMQVYALREGAFFTADKQVVKHAGKFCHHSIANDATITLSKAKLKESIANVFIDSLKDIPSKTANEVQQIEQVVAAATVPPSASELVIRLQ
jgi:hypothetical protein